MGRYEAPPQAEADPVAGPEVASEATRAQAAEIANAAALSDHEAAVKGVHGLSANPVDGQAIVWDEASSSWRPQPVVSNSHGLLADGLPDIASVADGSFHEMVDENGGTMYQAQSGVWVRLSPATKELAYAEVASDFTGLTNTTYSDVTGLSITFTPRGNPLWLELYIGTVQAGTAGQLVYGSITSSDALTTYVEHSVGFAGQFYTSPLTVKRRFLPATFPAGVPVTVKARTKASAGTYGLKGAATAGSSTGPMSLRAVEA